MPRTKKSELKEEKSKEEKETEKKTAKKSEAKEDAKEDSQVSKETKEREDKLTKLKEKATKLAKTLDEKEVELKKLKEVEKETLIPIEDYLKSSIHLGTRAITPDMRPYVYKRRADSLAVFNTSILDDKIREGAEFLSKFAPEDIITVCKREAGHTAAKLFSEATGIKIFTKQYPAGILTNPNLEKFMETELVLICDPWTDKNALFDANKIKIPVLAICDTNNYAKGVTKIIPGNNKSSKSLGMIFHLLAKLYVEKRKLKTKVPPIQEFVEGWDDLVPPK